MLKKNSSKVVISSIIILLPILFGVIMWNDLPCTMTTHWGADSRADGFSAKAFAVFGLPVILLALHFVCLLFTLLDKKQQNQDPKALGIVFWIIPVLSLFANGAMYGAALGKEFNAALLAPVLFGLVFIIIGNILPKARQNRTLGIKVYWALNNEENWNRTHRLGGKLWVAGGLIMLLSVFLPAKAMTAVFLGVIAVVITVPIVYSYCIYRQHQKEGIVYAAAPKSGSEKTAVVLSSVLGAVIIIGVAVLMFTGNIEVICEDEAFKIEASYWTDLEIAYSEIDTVEYSSDLDVGVRTNGFGSSRLSLGNFKNEEFGAYTLYAYTGAKEFVVLTSDAKTLVIGMRYAKDTQAIYDTMLDKIAD